jgi:hypothetical protein
MIEIYESATSQSPQKKVPTIFPKNNSPWFVLPLFLRIMPINIAFQTILYRSTFLQIEWCLLSCFPFYFVIVNWLVQAICGDQLNFSSLKYDKCRTYYKALQNH